MLGGFTEKRTHRSPLRGRIQESAVKGEERAGGDGRGVHKEMLRTEKVTVETMYFHEDTDSVHDDRST